MAPMDTTTGLPSFFMSASSWRISSLASALPPPVLMRRTRALTRLSSRALRICRIRSSEPIWPTVPVP